MHKFTKFAVEEAKKSDFKYQVGAIVFNKNIIISYGHNVAQRSVKHMLSKFQRWPNSIHAEVAAVLNAKTDLRGMSLLVVRVNSKNQLVMSKPCEHCASYLSYVGIKKVYFSINEYPYMTSVKLN
jgi:deoxycytidylate deaminase